MVALYLGWPSEAKGSNGFLFAEGEIPCNIQTSDYKMLKKVIQMMCPSMHIAMSKMSPLYKVHKHSVSYF